MKLYINDRKAWIVSIDNVKDKNRYDKIIHGDEKISAEHLKGDVLVLGASRKHVFRVLELMEEKKFKQLKSIRFAVKDKETVVDYVKNHFKLVVAAGGVVQKGDKVLLIHRQGVWDLPKGKLDPGESKEECAVREVEEECSVKVFRRQRFCTSWHTYTRNKKKVLKKTYWYKMDCVDDSEMKPQEKEKIDAVEWVSKSEAKKRLKKSYASIQRVIKKYYKE